MRLKSVEVSLDEVPPDTRWYGLANQGLNRKERPTNSLTWALCRRPREIQPTKAGHLGESRSRAFSVRRHAP